MIGREKELSTLLQLLGERRLVTVVGPPGVGKTTLAGAAARRSGDGLWVSFRGAADDDDAAMILAREISRVAGEPAPADTFRDAWGVPRWAGRVESLGAATIVLDECELAIGAARRMAELLLEASDTVKVIATSRHPLAAADETLVRLEPLDVPASAASVAEISTSSAVRILLEANPAADPEALAEVARAVDGLPLALVLARELLATFSAREVADRLKRSTLTLPLESAFRSSWEPLASTERSVLGAACLFEGSFTLEALESALPEELRTAALGAVGLLVKRSLVSSEDAAGTTRLRVLAVLRQYVLADLAGSQELERLLTAFDQSVLARAAHESSADDPALCLDLAALVDRAIRAKAVDRAAVRGLGSLAHLVRFQWSPGRLSALIQRALELTTERPLTSELRALWARSLANDLRLSEAVEQSELALSDARVQADITAEVRALRAVADLRARACQAQGARAALEELERLRTTTASNNDRLSDLALVGAIEWRVGSVDAVWRAAVSGLALAEKMGERLRVASFRLLLGQACAIMRDVDESERHLARVQVDAGALAAPVLTAAAHTARGLGDARRGDLSAARVQLAAALDVARRAGLPRAEIWNATYLGVIDYLESGSFVRLEDAAVRVDLDEPLLLLVPLLAAVAGSSVGVFLLDEGLARVRAALPDSEVFERFLGACSAARAADAERLVNVASSLPPAFQPDLALCGLMMKRSPRSSATAPRATLRVATDAGWFAVAGAERVSLRASPTSRRLLARLVLGHARAERGLTLEQLREAAWPGDRSLADAAANRVYVALSRLRDRGLREVIVRERDGWRIHPAVRIESVES